jgi:hypothetical protein
MLQIRQLKEFINSIPSEYLDFYLGMGDNESSLINGKYLNNILPVEHFKLVPEDMTLFILSDKKKLMEEALKMNSKMN